MALIDKLSKFAKSVGDEAVNAAKKSGELIEITKLNHSISNEEDKINVLFKEMGSTCYQKFINKESIDPDLLSFCSRIDEVKNNIATLKQKILEVKSVKICQSCGAELAYDIMFCAKCGSKQSTPETIVVEELKTCPNCSSNIPLDSAFCTSCGTKI